MKSTDHPIFGYIFQGLGLLTACIMILLYIGDNKAESVFKIILFFVTYAFCVISFIIYIVHAANNGFRKTSIVMLILCCIELAAENAFLPFLLKII